MAPRKDKNKDKKRDDSSSDSGPDDKGPAPAPKKAKTSTAKEDEEPSWSLGNKRFLKIREFRGKLMVDIREFYEKDGELMPGKKGLALSVDQWKKLVSIVDEVEKALSEK